MGFWGEGGIAVAPTNQLVVRLGNAVSVSSSVGSGAKPPPPAAKSFDAFWILQVSSPSPAVLLCKADKLGALLRGSKRISFCPVVSALRGRAPQLPRGSDAFAFWVTVSALVIGS